MDCICSLEVFKLSWDEGIQVTWVMDTVGGLLSLNDEGLKFVLMFEDVVDNFFRFGLGQVLSYPELCSNVDQSLLDPHHLSFGPDCIHDALDRAV